LPRLESRRADGTALDCDADRNPPSTTWVAELLSEETRAYVAELVERVTVVVMHDDGCMQ